MELHEYKKLYKGLMLINFLCFLAVIILSYINFLPFLLVYIFLIVLGVNFISYHSILRKDKFDTKEIFLIASMVVLFLLFILVVSFHLGRFVMR